MIHVPSTKAKTRHVVSINDLSKTEIERIFEIAQGYLDDLGDKPHGSRIVKSCNVASSSILATLFYEPSTRTRLSFESAMLRLGGRVITSADPATSSSAKGESLADTVRVVGGYANAIVVRHPRDGAARLAADYSPVPIINGGDGSHEHPTQTLCDIFTLKKSDKPLKDLNVAISGDLKGSRTIHSLVYALARFGANIIPMAAEGMELPKHVDRRLREEFHAQTREVSVDGKVDVVYVTQDESQRRGKKRLKIDIEIDDRIDAFYVTRFQKERWEERSKNYPTINASALSGERYAKTSILHPLPRVGELDAELDSDPRSAYFQQASYGVPVRMALIAGLLDIVETGLKSYAGGFEPIDCDIYDRPLGVGVTCTNSNCIVHDPAEKHSARNKFLFVPRLGNNSGIRCYYCETDIDNFVFIDRNNGYYTENFAPTSNCADLDDQIIIENQIPELASNFSKKVGADFRGPRRT